MGLEDELEAYNNRIYKVSCEIEQINIILDLLHK